MQLTGSGSTILREVIAAADLLRNDWGVERPLERPELQRTAPRRHRLRALESAAPDGRTARAARRQMRHVTEAGPVVAATDHMRIYADSVRPYIKKTYKMLGTDGF